MDLGSQLKHLVSLLMPFGLFVGLLLGLMYHSADPSIWVLRQTYFGHPRKLLDTFLCWQKETPWSMGFHLLLVCYRESVAQREGHVEREEDFSGFV